MKKTKILAPALGILALSMAASVTGTVAWFSSNATVTAEGMHIKATTATNLYIRNSSINEGAFGTDPTPATMYNDPEKAIADITDNGALVLDPASTDYAGDFQTWYKVADPTKIAIGGTVYENSAAIPSGAFTSVSIAAGNVGALNIRNVVNIGRFYLYLQDVEARNVNATVTISKNTVGEGDNEGMYKVCRFAMIFSEQTAAENKEAASGLSRKVWSADADSTTIPMTGVDTLMASAQTTSGSGESVTLGAMVCNKVVRVDCYFWMEGQDSLCVNEQSLHANQYDVAISFTATTIVDGRL